MNCENLAVYGLHGESHAAPMGTLTAYWAALGAGAEGIAAGLQMTKDGVAVCCPRNILKEDGGTPYRVSDITAQELHDFDAGAAFRSTVLDADNQPTGEKGEDTPWAGGTPKKPALYYPRLDEVLRLFGRRTQLMLLITDEVNPQHAEAIGKKAMKILASFGLLQRVMVAAPGHVCRLITEQSPGTPTALTADPAKTLPENLEEALQVQARFLYTTIEEICKYKTLLACPGGSAIKFLLTSETMPYAPTPAAYSDVLACRNVHAVVMRSVDHTLRLGDPPALVLSDDFEGTEINRDRWSCGYSHCNEDTTVSQDNGFIISIKEGGSYSGGAALTLLPIAGRFDAHVDIQVSNPHQGTTFEMACIGIDPGYFHIDNTDLDSRNVNLTFDVHGAPPYASSERDENDGFRIGWNNGYNLTKVDPDWQASSVNMYNKYGRDVGNGAKDNPTGSLRLRRNGTVFNAYYKDKYNKAWVCSGSALVGNLGPDVHIRLGGKHWGKGGETPPWNKFVFTHFRLFQF
jgi:glycerophosphoryl diester phosphodiesterase